MERKAFLSRFLASGGLLLSAPAVFYSCSKESTDEPSGNNNTGGNTDMVIATIDLNSSSYSSLKTAGNYAYKDNIIIVNSGGNYMAFSKICTHEGCTVEFSSSATYLECKCHGSEFNLTGSVKQGPATLALKKYTLTLNGNSLVIK